MTIVLFLFCVLQLSAAMSTSDVLMSIMGTDDVAKLQSIAKDPMAYWEERRKALFEGEGDNGRSLYSHQEFLKIFTQQTKERCQHFITQGSGHLKYNDGWFKNLDAFEAAVCSGCPESDPVHSFVKANAYAYLCDRLIFGTTWSKKGHAWRWLDSEEDTIKRTQEKRTQYTQCYGERLNREMFWLFEKNGLFSMWDCLVVMGEEGFLGSVLTDPEARDDLYVHDGAITCHSGSLTHDPLHAVNIAEYFDAFQHFGENLSEYVKDSFKEQNTGDSVLSLCQKVFTGFFTLHELKPNTDTPEELIFPEKINKMKDNDFNEILGFLLGSEESLLRHDASNPWGEMVDDALTINFCAQWRKKYFDKVGKVYIRCMRREQERKDFMVLLGLL